MPNSRIIGTGSYLPSTILTNDELAKRVDTSDEWIRTRTGICQRHIAGDAELTSSMAAMAAKRCLESAGISADSIDRIIVATTTPDRTFPSTAVKVQQQLGAVNAAAFDIQAVCSGFVYSLSIADAMIKSHQAKRILLIGAEKMSSVLDWEDRNTCILFGDGAGAVLLDAVDDASKGILTTHLFSDGSHYESLFTDGGVALSGKAGVIHMDGKEIFRHATVKMTKCVKIALAQAELSANDIDYIVPHQANMRIMEYVGKKLKLPAEKLITTVDQHGNTSAASIPLAMDHAANEGRFKSDDLIALTALGAGLTWGSALIRW